MVRFYFLLRLKLFEAVFEMFFVNYFVRQELLKKPLTDAEIDVKKVCWYYKDCKKCERFCSISSKFKRRVFQHLTKVLNIGMLQITNNLKLDLLENLDFGCNFYRSVFKPVAECEHANVYKRGN